MSNEFTSIEDKASYAIGQQVGEHLSGHPFKAMNFAAVVAGLQDQVNGADSQVSQEEQDSALNEINQQLQAAAEAQEKQSAGNQIEAGEAFLSENAKREDVSVTDTGLQYEVISSGSGDKPVSTDKVKVHYHGTLIDGTVFDSSVDRGEPLEFGVTQVIAGWTEALQLMPVGSKWKLYIPQDLAYGSRGAGAVIKPYSTLVFEVELLAIV